MTIQLVASYLDQIGWRYTERFDKNAITSQYSDEGIEFDVNIIYMERQQVLYIVADNYIDAKEAVDELHALLLMKKAMEENYAVLVGKFEWDPESGILKYSCTIDTDDGVSYELFKAVFATFIKTAVDKMPGLLAVAKGQSA
jgi:hypothetical protein